MAQGKPEDEGPPARTSDFELVQACLGGDSNSFSSLVARYQGAVAALLWRFTRDRLVLEELVQDTFVEVFLSLRRYRSEAPFYPWLRTIATRVGYRYWRRRRIQRDRQAVLDEWRRGAVADAPDASAAETADFVYRLLELLDPKDRLVLTLQYFDGCSTKEIAERMGWSQSLVKVRAFRARNKLRMLLSQAERDEHERT